MVVMMGKAEREANLVDRILELLGDTLVKNPVFVGHRRPDDDVWLCFWIAIKFMLGASNPRFLFLNAGESVPERIMDPEATYIYFDTAKGEYDQHGKKLVRTCSAAILAEKLQLFNNLETKAGLEPLLEMVKKVDNIEPLSPDSIHYIIEGYPNRFNERGTINWTKIQERVFEAFDIMFDQAVQRERNRRDYQKYAQKTILPNGLKVVNVGFHPGTRDEAFKDGAAVVIFHNPMGKNKFKTVILRSRNYPNLFLDNVVARIRWAEANVRGTNIEGASSVGTLLCWFMHDFKAMVSNGSRTYKPADEEYTKLTPEQISGIVNRVLGIISKQVVDGWKK